MNLATRLGSFLYRSAEFISLNLTATHKVTATFDYRRRWHEFLDPTQLPNTEDGLWIHGASVGELEDLAAFFGNEALLKKAGYSYSQLILTSSSPSAEEFLLKQKKKLNPRYAGPIPPDVLPRVEEFFDKVKPRLLVLSQSDSWPVLLSVATKRLPKGALWLPHKSKSSSWNKNWILAPLVKKVALRRKNSTNPLPQTPSLYIGSPRIDRILERIEATQHKEHPLAHELNSNESHVKLIVGSGWKEDATFIKKALDLLSPDLQKKLSVFFIPHEPKNSHEISLISSYLSPYLEKNMVLKEGILLESYQSFDIAFVGGAFRSGLHNIVEPLAWGIPTLCGPDIKKQPEAKHFISLGALQNLSDPMELKKILEDFISSNENAVKLKSIASAAKEELKAQQGASERLAELIQTL